MDRTTLVDKQCVDGQRLIEILVKNEFDVQAAAWIKTSDDAGWCLYIASSTVDTKGSFSAYLEIQSVIQKMPKTSIGPLDVKLLSATHVLVADIERIYQRFPAPLQTHFGGSELGKMNIEDALIYPPVSTRLIKQTSRPRSRTTAGKRAVKSEL